MEHGSEKKLPFQNSASWDENVFLENAFWHLYTNFTCKLEGQEFIFLSNTYFTATKIILMADNIVFNCNALKSFAGFQQEEKYFVLKLIKRLVIPTYSQYQ